METKGQFINAFIGYKGMSAAKWIPTGEKISRLWKVWLTLWSQYFWLFRSMKSIGWPAASASIIRSVSKPLSGAPYNWLPKRVAIAYFLVLTPGSTTATCALPSGKKGAWRQRAKAACNTFCGSMVWVMSTILASGQIPKMTPFITPTNLSRIPKSVSNEITNMDKNLCLLIQEREQIPAHLLILAT